MPTIQVTGQLVDPTAGAEGSAEIRITSIINYGQTTKKSISHESTDANGNYDFPMVYGKHLILVKFESERIYNKIGYAVVGDSTPDPIDLIQLISLSDENPPSELVTELQQLREDTLNDIVSTSAEVLENAGYKGLWPDTGGSALEGETWQTQVGGTPTGDYYTALQNTSVDPVGDDVNWKVAVSSSFVNQAQEETLPPGSKIYPRSGYLANGMTVTAGTTHLRVLVGGEPTIVAMSPVTSGVVSDLNDYSAEIGGASVLFLLVSRSGVYVMSAAAWGIVVDDADHLPPYTTQEYVNAYNNGKRIELAINLAHELGYSEILLPRGRITVCYEHLTDATFQSHGCVNISTISNIGVNLNGCTLDVLYDSENKSPYDTSANAAWQLDGNVFVLNHTENVNIYNGTLLGDCYKRAWLSGEEWVEQCYGVLIRHRVKNTKIYNMSISGFAGDGISGNGLSDSNGVDISETFTSGDLDSSTGLPTVLAGAYYSEAVDISSLEIIGNRGRLTAIGYTRKYDARNKLFKILFYDVSDNVVYTEKIEQLENVHIPEYASYFRVVFYDDERSDSTVNYASNMRFVSGLSSGLDVTQCDVFNNHRGGMSNLPCESYIHRNRLHSNGQGLKQGWPIFPDNTRYAVNCEDGMVTNVVLENNDVKDHYNTFLLNVYSGEVKGHTDASGELGFVGIYDSEYINVHDNQHTSTGSSPAGTNFVSSTTQESSMVRRVNASVNNNEIWNCGLTSSIGLVKWSVNGNKVHNGFMTYAEGFYSANQIEYLDVNYSRVIANRGKKTKIANDRFESAFANQSTQTGYRRLSVLSEQDLPPSTIAVTTEHELRIDWGQFQTPTENMYTNGLTIDSTNVVNFRGFVNDNTAPAATESTIKIEKYDIAGSAVYLQNPTSGSPIPVTMTWMDSVFRRVDIRNYVDNPAEIQNDMTLIFVNCTFDVTGLSRLCYNPYETAANRVIKFVNCTFIADTMTSIALVSGSTVNTTASCEQCSFYNVTNTDGVTVIN